MIHPSIKYAEDVLSGDVLACKLVHLACQRHLNDLEHGKERGLWFDYDAADYALEFFSHLRLWKGTEYKGKEFVLAPHFQFITSCIMGWKRDDGTRRFRTAYIEMGRKGAKSTYAGGLGAYFLTSDGEDGAEIYCLDPLTKILKTDLTWITISEAKVGDELICFDEYPLKPSQYRKMRKAKILNKALSLSKTYKIILSDDSEIICGENHPWLCKTFRAYGWFQTKNLKIGHRIAKLCDPWVEDKTKEAGYLAGIFDGEGYFHAVHKKRAAHRIGFTQNDGIVTDYTLQLLKEKEFYFNGRYKSKHNNTTSYSMTGMSNCFQFLGKIRPKRLIDDSEKLWFGKSMNRSMDFPEIVSIKCIGENELIDIQTETGTFFANGFCSHNTAAVKKDQAKIVWTNTQNLLKKSIFAPLVTFYKHNLSVESTWSKCEPLSSDTKSLDGLDTHFASLDELHAHPTPEVYDLVVDSIGARAQPLILIITTAGFDQAGVCYQRREYLTKILKGVIQDDSFFGVIYTLDTKRDWPKLLTIQEKRDGKAGDVEDDWQDEDLWIKPMPGLCGITKSGQRFGIDENSDQIPGYMTKLEDVRDKCRVAKEIPANQNNFLTKRMNIWVGQYSRWITLDLWDENFTKDVYCYG